MSKTAISQYSATPSSNSDVDGIDISEGCPASNLNNAQRSLMSHLKEMDDGTSALTSPSMGQLNVDNLRLDGNTISSTDTNGDITIDPDGTGDIVASSKVGVGVAPNATFGSHLYVQGTPAVNKPIISGYSQGNSNNAGIALFNDAGNRGIWTTGSTMRFTRTYEGNSTADVTIDASGNVGIGTASPDALVHLSGTNPKLHIRNSNDSNRGGYLEDNGTTFALGTNSGVRNLVFSPDNTERMRIDTSGHVGIGTTTLTGSGTPDETDNATGIRLLSSGFIGIGRDAGICGQFNRNNAGAILGFRRAGGEVGTISVSNTATAYNTSSDYRLKTAVTYDWDATTRLKQLRPARFKWIVDGDDAVPVDGFLAHEAATVCPESVSGSKDAVEVWKDGEELPDGVSIGDNKLDDDGNTIPLMQGIDQAKIVPLLTKALIESVEKIEQLEARITALEAE